MSGKKRLDKLLCHLGLTTRAYARNFVHKFDVKVNGVKPLSVAKFISEDEVTIGGKPLEYTKPLHILIHKPVGYVTSRRKELMGDGKFIFELLPESFLRRKPPLVPAGRLDKWASGAIICTQNGGLVNSLTSPSIRSGSYGKVYEVKLQKKLTGNEAKLFATGDLKLKSDSKPCKPALFEVINADERLVKITLYEGRYHQVRRMLGALGNKVEQIKRVATGPIQLGDLPVGHWRLLTQSELDILDVRDEPKPLKKRDKYRRKNREEKEMAKHKKLEDREEALQGRPDENERDDFDENDTEGEYEAKDFSYDYTDDDSTEMREIRRS